MKKRVLFICTHNSARSQMAEGLMNALYRDKYEAFSAGTEPSQVNPFAIKAMVDIGIDISMNRSKGINEFQGTEFDYVVTVCDNAKDTCPTFTDKGKHIHRSFDDPSRSKGSDDERLAVFKTVRDNIKDWIEDDFILNIS